MRRFSIWCLAIALCMALAATATAAPPAQDDEVYIVQPGDTLSAIAAHFDVKAGDIATANNLSDPNFIFVGQQLVIPVIGVVVEPAIVTEEPGSEPEKPAAPLQTYTVQAGDTMGAIAGRFGVSVTELVIANDIRNPDFLFVGQQLAIPRPASSASKIEYAAPFAAVEHTPNPVLQGQTLVVRVKLSEAASLSGDFDGRPIFFSGDADGSWGLVGIHALQEVGTYSVALRAKMDDGTETNIVVNVVVGAGPYATENIQLAPGRESLLDPQIVRAEQAQMVALWSQVSSRPLWEGPFNLPLPSVRITSSFGTRRSYNDGPVSGFHGGTDFGAGSGVPIYTPAAGRVVLADELTVRGKAVLIDHGLGVFSGYWHQSELAVRQGQSVERGNLIGYVGDTGLVTGAHLHWEMRVGGIAVDPMQWTETDFRSF